MKAKVWTGLRVFLGFLFTLFGLNFFFHFLPQPPLPEPALNLIMAMAGSGYLMILVKVTEIVGGLLLLTGKYQYLALLLLAPISVNIAAFHLFLDPAGGIPAYLIFAINAYLGFSKIDVYKEILKA